MPTLTDSILDIRQEAPPHDRLLVVDERELFAQAASDAQHTADQLGKRVALFYRGVICVADPDRPFEDFLSEVSSKVEKAPDRDPEAAAFPDHPQ